MNTLALLPFAYKNIIMFILIMSRILALFSTFILFRKDYVSTKITVALSTILAVYVLLSFNHVEAQVDIFSFKMLKNLTLQGLIGFFSGLFLNIIMEIFTAFGQIVSSQIGLSMVTLIDPRYGSITPLTLFYNYLAIIIFLALNGHLFIFKLIFDSFTAFPIELNYIPANLLTTILTYSKIIFSAGVSLSIAVIISVMLANLTLAVMTRFAPQFNVFSVGINITLILGLIFLYITFEIFVDQGFKYFESGLNLMKQLLFR